MSVALTSKYSSDVTDERHANDPADIELQLNKLSLTSRVNEVEIARRPSSEILVMSKLKSSSDVKEERHANASADIDSQLLKLSLASRVNEMEIAWRPSSVMFQIFQRCQRRKAYKCVRCYRTATIQIEIS